MTFNQTIPFLSQPQSCHKADSDLETKTSRPPSTMEGLLAHCASSPSLSGGRFVTTSNDMMSMNVHYWKLTFSL